MHCAIVASPFAYCLGRFLELERRSCGFANIELTAGCGDCIAGGKLLTAPNIETSAPGWRCYILRSEWAAAC